jgi:hypothetical protein
VTGLSPGWLALLLLVNAAFAYGIVRRWRPPGLVAAMAVLVGMTGIWFNPLVRGGAGYLSENPLAERILDIDRNLAGESVWLTYGNSDLPDLIPAIGVRGIGGSYSLPQLPLWEILDPDGENRFVYNRYAHVAFARPKPDDRRARFRLNSHQAFVVWLDPEGDEIESLGVTHLLVRIRPSSMEYWNGFEALHDGDRNRIYALPLRPAR